MKSLRFLSSFSIKCIRDTKATYGLDTCQSHISVENICTREDGGRNAFKAGRGRAKRSPRRGWKLLFWSYWRIPVLDRRRLLGRSARSTVLAVVGTPLEGTGGFWPESQDLHPSCWRKLSAASNRRDTTPASSPDTPDRRPPCVVAPKSDVLP